jgi:uncharacterized membrane protein
MLHPWPARQDDAMILQISPESSALVRGAAALVLILHISGGSVGILSGATALFVRKGSPLHRLAGNIFFVSILTMSGIGACVAPFLTDRGSTVMGMFTFYLVASAWMTVKRKEGSVGVFEKVALCLVVTCVALDFFFGLQAANSPAGTLDGNPAALFFVFGSIMALAAIADLKMILRGGISGAQRIARHVWRMCFALFIATGSFFLGQQKVMPAFMHGSPVLVVLGIAPLPFMIFWLCRVHFTTAYKKFDIQRPSTRRDLHVGLAER